MDTEECARDIEFDTWIAVSALLLKRNAEERCEILDERDIDPEAWERADERWIGALAREIAAGDLERAGRYGVACKDELERRAVSSSMASPESTLPAVRGVSGGPPLPFGPPAPAPAPSRGAPNPIGAGSDGDTSAPELRPAKGAATPFESGGSDPESSLEAYASLRADLARSPERRAAILSRHGIDGATALGRIESAWRDRFAADPAVRERWLAIYTKLYGRGPA